MNGPFTCEQLRNIRQVAIDHEFNTYTDSIVDNIKNDILDKAIGDVSDPHQLIYKSQDSLPPTQYSVLIRDLQPVKGKRFKLWHLFTDKKSIVQAVLTKLKVVFPDMKIMIDPLHTYILLDWS